MLFYTFKRTKKGEVYNAILDLKKLKVSFSHESMYIGNGQLTSNFERRFESDLGDTKLSYF